MLRSTPPLTDEHSSTLEAALAIARETERMLRDTIGDREHENEEDGRIDDLIPSRPRPPH